MPSADTQADYEDFPVAEMKLKIMSKMSRKIQAMMNPDLTLLDAFLLFIRLKWKIKKELIYLFLFTSSFSNAYCPINPIDLREPFRGGKTPFFEIIQQR